MDGIDALLADRAIRDLLLRYCRGIDRMDRDLVRACYHPGARDSHGTFEGGVEEFLDWVWRVLSRYTATMHYVANQLVELHPDDPARARSEAYGVAVHRTEGGDAKGNLTTGFRFVDDVAWRADGGWRIVRRRAVTEWVTVTRTEDRWPIPVGMLVGRRDRTDPVYDGWA